jgi:long-chain fatty acid transport protein
VRARLAALALLWSGVARGSNVLEIPDNGSEAMARGGAWIAKASDPLATLFNPAGLAGQTTQVTVQTNIVVQHTCFSRVRAENDTSVDPLASADGRFPRVCSDIEPALNPQLGASLRLSERLGVGVLLYGPAAAGRATWPEFVDDHRPAPQRYLLTRQRAVLVFPTVGVGWRVLSNLRIGASAGWGITHVKSALATVALASGAQNADNDIRANLQVKDLFVPRITVGAIWSVTPFFRSRRHMAMDRSHSRARRPRDRDQLLVGAERTRRRQRRRLRRYGLRRLRNRAARRRRKVRERRKRDALSSDSDGSEARDARSWADATRRLRNRSEWANDSALDVVRVRFPAGLPLSGINAEIPQNADQPRRYRDVLGVRAGGDVEIVPSFVVRGGASFETAAGREEYQRLDAAATERLGIAVGGAWRLPIDRVRAELAFGYGHTFIADARREDRNANGIGAIAGGAPYRTAWPVNLGTITNAVNTVNVGAVVGF